jgi:two-component system phosphate regulon sensor histidine kinase PhoR
MNEGLFEAVFNVMPEAVFIVDSDLRLLCANARAHSLFGIPKNAQSLLEATFSTELEDAAKKTALSNEPSGSEVVVYKNGRQYFFLAFIFPLENHGIVLILSDTTRLHRLEKVRKDFAANVSHELRTPIQLIKGYAETMLEQRPNYEQLIQGMEIILKNAVTMENLTNDLLTLVSLEHEPQSAIADSSNNFLSDPSPLGLEDGPRLEMTETNILGLLQEAVNSVEAQRKTKNIEIIVSCAGELSALLYGPLIIQALINLLDNAIKYSPPASKVKGDAEIAVSPIGRMENGEQGAENREQRTENRELFIKVKDKGIGIPREYQERIFERFFRVDTSRSREAGGTGLGLAIVRHIALLHRGRVEVESHAREGSCFTLRVPLGLRI